MLHAVSDEVFDEVTGKHERILPRACIFPKSSDAVRCAPPACLFVCSKEMNFCVEHMTATPKLKLLVGVAAVVGPLRNGDIAGTLVSGACYYAWRADFCIVA